MKITVRIALWTALLLGGAKAISVVTFHTGLSGSGAGIGWFSYWFRCTLLPESIYEGQEESVGGSVTIEGNAPPRFKAHGGVSPVYDKVALEWHLRSGGAAGLSEGQAEVDLVANKIQANGDPVPLEASGLAKVFGIDDSPANAVFLNALFDFLADCRSGDIPRPRHHTRRFDDSTEGYMQHFASGSSIRYPIIIWFGIWLALIVAASLIPRLTAKVPRTGAR